MQESAAETGQNLAYGGRVSDRLRELRIRCGWSVEQLRVALAAHGHSVPASTIYAYERGRRRGGIDLPWSLVPAVASVYGYKQPRGWLPD